jgi:hypothetical protein
MATPDVHVRSVVVAAALLAATVLAAVLSVALLLRHWGVPLDVDPVRLPMTGPLPQSAPQFDMQRYRAEKQRLLATTEWIAGEPGRVRIPIGSAMALMAEDAASAPGARP